MSTPSPVPSDLQNPAQLSAPSASIGDLGLPLFQSKGWMKFVGVMFIIHGVLMGFVAIGFAGYIFTNDIIGEIGSARGLSIIPGIDAILFELLLLAGTLLLIWTGALVLRAAGAIGRAR